MQREHRAGGLVDVAHERDRPLQDRLQPLLVLDARLRVLVLDDEVRVRDVELQELARRELVIEPVDGAVLQVRERIVPRRTITSNSARRVVNEGTLKRVADAQAVHEPLPYLYGIAPGGAAAGLVIDPHRDQARLRSD